MKKNKISIEDLHYNMRQISLIEEKIAYYRAGNFKLRNFISDFFSLIGLIRGVSIDWFNSILGLANEIEIVYAGLRYDNRNILYDNEQDRVNKALSGIVLMINAYKKENPLKDLLDEEYEEYLRLYPDFKE